MKKILATTFVLFTLLSATYAQEAKVIQLSAQDATDARRFYEEYKAAELRWQKFQEVVKVKYTQTVKGEKDADAICSSGTFTVTFTGEPVRSKADDCIYYRKGWYSGFTFSTDFRFIVPESKGLVVPCYGTLITK